jgi:hypothetical protein
MNTPIVSNGVSQAPDDALRASELAGELLLEACHAAEEEGAIAIGKSNPVGYYTSTLGCINTILWSVAPGVLIGRTEQGLHFYIDDATFSGIGISPIPEMRWRK